MNARGIIVKPFLHLLLVAATGLCQQLDNEPIVVPASNRALPTQQPEYIYNRTCNAYRLYAIGNYTHSDHFQNERCGRYVSHLIIKRSVIHYIPANFFIHKTSFEHLLTLKMENVSIKAIYPHDFENIPHLEVLELASNQIENLPADTFKHLPALQVIDLSNNRIATIDAYVFRGCVHLQRLQLNGNRLTVLMPEWFSGLNSMKFVDFSDNLIESDFDGDIFEGATGMQLFVRNNRIQRILNFGSRPDRATFRLIDLSGNMLLRPPYPQIVGSNRNMSLIY